MFVRQLFAILIISTFQLVVQILQLLIWIDCAADFT